MGKATSDRAPEERFTVERNPMRPDVCDVTFYAYDGSEDQVGDGGEPIYVFGVHRLIDWPWRPTLAADIEAHYDAWLASAIAEEAKAKAHEPTIEERQEQTEAALMELAAMIAGGM